MPQMMLTNTKTSHYGQLRPPLSAQLRRLLRPREVGLGLVGKLGARARVVAGARSGAKARALRDRVLREFTD